MNESQQQQQQIIQPLVDITYEYGIEMSLIFSSILWIIVINAMKFIKNRMEMFERYLSVSPSKMEDLRTQLNEILRKSAADRVVLYSFHNGEKLLSGRCLIKLTLTGIVKLPGTPDFPRIHGQPADSLVNEFSVITRDIHNITWMDNTSICKSYMEKLGIIYSGTYLFTRGLFNSDILRVPVAILGIHYLEGNDNYLLLDDERREEITKLIKHKIYKLI